MKLKLQLTLLLVVAITLQIEKAVLAETYQLTSPIVKSIFSEDYYQYYVMDYYPTREVKVYENTIESINSIDNPERTAVAYLSSQAQGNFDWYYSLLSADYKNKLANDLEVQRKSKENLLSEWKAKFNNVKVVFTNRIERGLFSIIHYSILSITDGSNVEDSVAISLDENGAFVVSDLSTDPVFQGWNLDNN